MSPRVILISFSAATLSALSRRLRARGFAVEVVEHVTAAKQLDPRPRPRIVLLEGTQCSRHSCLSLGERFDCPVARMEATLSERRQKALVEALNSFAKEGRARAPQTPLLTEIQPSQARRAREIQRHLFPTPPPLVGPWELAFECRQAGAVGGDFCWYAHRGDHFLVALVDVMGKGYPAAILVGMMSSILEEMPGISETNLNKLNETICRRTPHDTSIAITFLQVDRVAGSLLYCNAGNPKPILLEESPRHLDEVEPAMGWFDGHKYRLHKIELKIGVVLICHSDGLDGDRIKDISLNACLRTHVQICLRQGQGAVPDDRAIIALRHNYREG